MDTNKGIIIVWPSHPDFKIIIEKELTLQEFTIVEKKQIIVSPNFIKNILLEIHYGKQWWDDNIETEYVKRIDTNNKTQLLHYLIIEKKDIHISLKGFKKQTREKYNIDKSYFHVSDPDCFKHLGKNCSCKCNKEEFNEEYNKHVTMLTHPNTMRFLQKATYKKKYNFYTYFNTYTNIILHNNIDKDNFCIDNGGILAAYGIRDTHDLDFLTAYTDTIQLHDPNIGCENKNHRLEYKRLGYSIKDIIDNPEHHFYHFGMKFMALHILKNFKYNRTHTIGTGHTQIRQKDINDFKLIESYI